MLELSQAKQLNQELTKMSKTLDLSAYKEAQERGMSFSEILEELDPSPAHTDMTAFDRQMQLFELIDRPGAPVTVEAFFVKNAMILLPEFIQTHVSRGYKMIVDPSELIATQVSVKGPEVKPIYIRVTEAQKGTRGQKEDAAAYPKSVLTYRSKSAPMIDRGREFDFSYRVVRNQSLEEFKVFLNYIGAQIAQDELDYIYTIIDSGDGTSAGGTDTFAGSAGTLAYSDIVTHAMTYTAPAQMTHILANQTDMATILNLSEYKDPEVWLAVNTVLSSGKMTGLLPLNAKLVICPNASTNNIASLDARFALRESIEQPLMIEADKVIEQKLEKSVISKSSVITNMIDGTYFTMDFSA